MATSPNPYPQPSYWDAVKERVGELSSMPGEWLRRHLTPEGAAGILHPNARLTAPAEAMPASVDPVQRQALIEAILRRQQQVQQPPANPDNPAGIQF